MSAKYANHFIFEQPGSKKGLPELPFRVQKKNIDPTQIQASFRAIMKRIEEFKKPQCTNEHDRPDTR